MTDTNSTPGTEQPDFGDVRTRVLSPLERLCSEFAESWRLGQRPELRAFLERLPPEERSTGLVQLLRVELQARRERGEEASEEEYRERYPTDTAEISLAFSTRGQTGVNTQADLEWSVATPGPRGIDPTEVDPARRSGEDEPQSPWAPGMMLGGFRLQQFLGKGGYGEVWKGLDTRLGWEVAIKLLRPRHLNTASQETFFEEARKLASLRLQGVRVLEVLGADVCGGWPFLVTRYLPGGTLRQRMRRQPRDWREASRVVAELAETLQMTHRQQIYHRDIKPENVLLDERGQVYLADFGLATSEDQQLRQGLATGGTWVYAAPEQCAQGITGGRTDIYALGVLFYEWLTGRWPGPTDPGLHARWLQQPLMRPQPPRELNEDVPEAVQEICLAMLEKNFDQRTITAGDVAQRLRSAVEPAVPSPSSPPAPPRRNWWIAAAVAMGMLGVAGMFGLRGLGGLGGLSIVGTRPEDEAVASQGREKWIAKSGVTPRIHPHIGIRGTEKMVFDESGETLILSTDWVRILEFDTQEQRLPKRIEMTIERPSLAGIAFFFNRHQVQRNGIAETEFRAMDFSEQTHDGSLRLLTMMNTFRIDPNTGSMTGIYPVSEYPIPAHQVPQKTVRLALNFADGFLESFELDGQEFDVPDRFDPSRTRLACPFGLINFTGTVFVSPPRLVYE